jgi:hypothetical protein
VAVVQQGPKENPLTFLHCLKYSIRKHTTVDPESQLGEFLLKDKFLAQSAPDIHRKLSLWLKEKKSLDKLIQLTMSVYYNWNLTKRREKDKGNIMTSLLLSERVPPNWDLHSQLATILDIGGTSLENALKGDSPRQPCPQPRP